MSGIRRPRSDGELVGFSLPRPLGFGQGLTRRGHRVVTLPGKGVDRLKLALAVAADAGLNHRTVRKHLLPQLVEVGVEFLPVHNFTSAFGFIASLRPQSPFMLILMTLPAQRPDVVHLLEPQRVVVQVMTFEPTGLAIACLASSIGHDEPAVGDILPIGTPTVDVVLIVDAGRRAFAAY